MTSTTQDAQFVRQAQPAEPDIAPVPDGSGHFVVGAVGVAEEGGACEAPGVAYGGRFAPEALMAALDELTWGVGTTDLELRVGRDSAIAQTKRRQRVESPVAFLAKGLDSETS